jgi:hexokinase
MLLTVVSVRCREESGSCYALDIGGTNFRVVYYKLSDKHGVVVSARAAQAPA